ncbi:MAG: sugar 3,4-ketoisomerase [Niabella sp.]
MFNLSGVCAFYAVVPIFEPLTEANLPMQNEPKIIQLPKIVDPRGNLSFFENNKYIPFSIARTYWIYDVPGGESRGGHAFKEQQEFIVALSGGFEVSLHNGTEELRFSLNRSYYGLYVPKLHWRKMENFSTNSLALIVSDKIYNLEDYIEDFDEFKKVNRD